MIEHETQLRVRYAETDQMGYVYYGQYLTYLEVARTELIRSLGLPYSRLEREFGVMLPVREVSVKYLRPIRYDEQIVLQTQVKSWPARRIRFDTQFKNELGKVTTQAWVELVFVSSANMRPCEAPEAFLQLVAPFWKYESDRHRI